MLKIKFVVGVLAGLGFMTNAQSLDNTRLLEVNFKLDSYYLRSEERAQLDSLFDAYPVGVVKSMELYGHTDSLASEVYNLHLSKKRVGSIKKYLHSKEIDTALIQTDFYGEVRPKYDNGPSERYRNRRCELVLTIDPALLPPPELKLTDLEFKTGDKVRIPNLIFVGNQPIPMSDSYPSLEELLKVMYQYPEMVVQLQGHVCCSDDYELSYKRAQSVYRFLRANGVDKSRLSFKGFSNRKKLFKERNEEEKRLNRRVEMFVVKNDGEKVKLNDFQTKVDFEAEVLNIKFFPKKQKMMLSGEFMLGLIADMLKNSEGFYYEFLIFDNINNPGLTTQRAAMITRKLGGLGVSRKMFKVQKRSAINGMPKSDNQNIMSVKIKKL